MPPDDPIVPASSPPPRPVAPKPVPPPPPAPSSSDSQSAGSSIVPAFIAMALAGVLVAAWIVQNNAPAKVPDAPALASSSSSTDANGADVPPTPTPVAGAEESPSSAITVAALKADLDALGKKIDGMPKPEAAPAPSPAVNLAPINEKLDALGQSVAPVAVLSKTVNDLSAKLAEAETAIAALKADLDAAKSEMAARPATATSSTPAAPALDAAAFNSAVALFKSNKFAEALEAFKSLPQDDARVVYFSALANGLSTRSWTGETETLVQKGVDLEKAGKPATAAIDTSFADLTDQQGKAWLAYYRQRAK